MVFRDKYGWPVEKYKGRPITNMIRLLLWTNIRQTWKKRKILGQQEDVALTIKCKMPSRWVPHFLSMLKYMQYLGGVGSSRLVMFYADGDGDFHPKFKLPKFEEAPPKKPCLPIQWGPGNRFYDAG